MHFVWLKLVKKSQLSLLKKTAQSADKSRLEVTIWMLFSLVNTLKWKFYSQDISEINLVYLRELESFQSL